MYKEHKNMLNNLNLLTNDQNRRLKDALIELSCVERTASICDAAAQITIGISTITAVASGFYNMPVLVFLSAGLNTTSVSLSRYSSTCKRRATMLTAFAKTLALAPPNKEIDIVLKSPVSSNDTLLNDTLLNDRISNDGISIDTASIDITI